jgi:hypothetical protein
MTLCHARMALAANAQGGLEDGERRGDRCRGAFQRIC